MGNEVQQNGSSLNRSSRWLWFLSTFHFELPDLSPNLRLLPSTPVFALGYLLPSINCKNLARDAAGTSAPDLI
jgi:hypothetical protein